MALAGLAGEAAMAAQASPMVSPLAAWVVEAALAAWVALLVAWVALAGEAAMAAWA